MRERFARVLLLRNNHTRGPMEKQPFPDRAHLEEPARPKTSQVVVRRAERQRRRALCHLINTCAAKLEAKHRAPSNIPASWGYEDAARNVESLFSLPPGSTSRYFCMVEHNASFQALYDWCPTRRERVTWDAGYNGPRLP